MVPEGQPCYWSSYYQANESISTNVKNERSQGEQFLAYFKSYLGPIGNETEIAATAQYQYMARDTCGSENCGVCSMNADGYADCVIRSASPEFGIKYNSGYGAEESLGYRLLIQLIDYDIDRGSLIPMGNITFDLPSSMDWDESQFGRLDHWVFHNRSVVHQADKKCKKEEIYGTCTFKSQFFAVKCGPGEYVDSMRTGHCLVCPDGYYCSDGVQAKLCTKGSFSSHGAYKCNLCAAGSFSDSAGMSQCKLCGIGRFSHLEGSSECSSCAGGYYGAEKGLDTSQCNGMCEVGFFCPEGSTNATARSCSSSIDKHCPMGSITELLVPNGYYAVRDMFNKTIQVKECEPGNSCSVGIKTPCGPLKYQDLVGMAGCNDCHACSSDSFISSCAGADSGTCQQCAFNSSNCLSPNVLVRCSGTTDDSACIERSRCSIGEYFSRNSCVPCSEGSYCPDGNSEQRCSPGDFSNVSRAMRCSACPPGTFINISGAIECLSCPAGTYTDDSGNIECSACEAGTFGTGGGSESTCNGKCAAGYYCPRGSFEMTPCGPDPVIYCPEGSGFEYNIPRGYHTLYESNVKTGIEKCSIGHFCVDGIKTLCPDLTYQDSMGQTSCKPCATCGEGEYVTECGGVDPGVCASCQFTQENRLSSCGSDAVIVECTGSTSSDTSQCYNCANYTGGEPIEYSNGTVDYLNVTDERWFNACSRIVVKNGIDSWVIGLIAGISFILIGVIVIAVIRKKRANMIAMRNLENQNKYLEEDRELHSSLHLNLNPMMRGSKVVHEDKIHRQEIDDLNLHKSMLEKELRRLKQESQEMAVVLDDDESRYKKPKTKKEFIPDNDMVYL